jgi:hypothetical protein
MKIHILVNSAQLIFSLKLIIIKVVCVQTTLCDITTEIQFCKFLITEKIKLNQSDQGSLLCPMPLQNP